MPTQAKTIYIAGEESGNKTNLAQVEALVVVIIFFFSVPIIACNGIVKVLGEIGG